MADPPWDIHMELPYGTMSDDEMRSVKLSSIQPTTGMGIWRRTFYVIYLFFQAVACTYVTRRGIDISLGDRASDGAWPRVSQAMGLRESRRNHLGQNQPGKWYSFTYL